jgi:hypothetical protein
VWLQDGYAPIYVAAGKGLIGIVEKLMNSGANVNSVTKV